MGDFAEAYKKPAQRPQGMFMAIPNPEGLVEPGNIDLASRPVVPNADGTISTVKSMSIGDNTGEVLVPMVSPSGVELTPEGALMLYRMTGKHLGRFSNVDAANAYAQALHDQQAKMYGGK